MPASPTPTLTPLDALRQPTVLVWAVLAGIGLAAVLSLGPGHVGGRLIGFGLATLTIQWIILGTLAILYALQRPLSRLTSRHALYLALFLLVAMTATVHLAAASLLPGMGVASIAGWDGQLMRAIAIALIVGLLGLAALQNHLRAQSLAVKAKQAELESLQARTHPHFLFNTLNTGAALVHARPDAAERLLLDLADLFRAALSGPSLIDLQEEIDLVTRYLAIEQLRLGDRLEVVWERPAQLPSAMVPALSLQPLVENAVRHGIEPRVGGGRIDILLTAADDLLFLTVRNDLPSGDAKSSSGHRIGLDSVGQRLTDMTGGRGTLSTVTQQGRYTATIELPIIRAGE